MHNENKIVEAYSKLLKLSSAEACSLATLAHDKCKKISEELHLQHNGYVQEIFLAEFVRAFNKASTNK